MPVGVAKRERWLEGRECVHGFFYPRGETKNQPQLGTLALPDPPYPTKRQQEGGGSAHAATPVASESADERVLERTSAGEDIGNQKDIIRHDS